MCSLWPFHSIPVYALLLLNDKPQSYPGFLNIGYSTNCLLESPINQIGTFSICCSAFTNTEIVCEFDIAILVCSVDGILIYDCLPSNIA